MKKRRHARIDQKGTLKGQISNSPMPIQTFVHFDDIFLAYNSIRHDVRKIPELKNFHHNSLRFIGRELRQRHL